jgi:single-strand DNA-binding protein
MNVVALVGRLATDVDLKNVLDGCRMASFILAVDRNAEEADFFRIKCWNDQADYASENLVKGRRISAEGSLRQETYEQDGEDRRRVVVIARRIEGL